MKTIADPVTFQQPVAKNQRGKKDPAGRRLARERQTMAAMVHLYCRGQHSPASVPCMACRQFLAYAGVRLERCRFGEAKPTCAQCPVHCYQRDRREQARRIMRYAGPRMVWAHPILSLTHWLDGFRKAPPYPETRNPEMRSAKCGQDFVRML